jgi:putative peptide zinc metalloprotease protein
LAKVDPLLALKFRAAVVPDSAVRSLTTVFRPLFLPPVMALVVLGLLGLDGWLFFAHGVSQSVRHILYAPALMLMLLGGVVLATAFHEIGHATACRYGGAKPGVMGVGIYIVWPAFYTDITDAYRLGKWGRLRTDLGGMYFNAVFALIVAGLYAATSFEPLLLLVVLQNFAIIQQALPLLRLDGYYILSDLTGVPDIFMRIRPVLASLIPRRPADKRVTELKSWVRAVVSVYVVLIVVFLAFTAFALVINLPRVIATGYDSAALHFNAIGPDLNRGQVPKGALDAIQTLFLILPGAGLAYTAARIGRRAGGGALSWSSGRPQRQTALALTGAAAVVIAALSWWPNGQYRPVQPSERGTLTGLVHEISALPTARPSLTLQRRQQLGGAPTERERESHQAPQPTADSQATKQSKRKPAPGANAAGTTAASSSATSSTNATSTSPSASSTTTTSATTSSTASPTPSGESTTPAASTTPAPAPASGGATGTTPAGSGGTTTTTGAPTATP